MSAVRVAVRLRPSGDVRPAWTIGINTITLDAAGHHEVGGGGTPRSHGGGGGGGSVSSATGSSSGSTPGCARRDSKTFTFDAVYGGCESQEEFFAREVMPVLAQGLALGKPPGAAASMASVASLVDDEDALRSSTDDLPCHVTIFAYGQTGSGKTHTVDGPPPAAGGAAAAAASPRHRRKANTTAAANKRLVPTSPPAEGDDAALAEGEGTPLATGEAAVPDAEDEAPSDNDTDGSEEDEESPMDAAIDSTGIAPRVIRKLFALRGEAGAGGGGSGRGGVGYTPVRIALSFMELYQERIYDLLNNVTNDDDIRPQAASAKSKQRRQGLLAPPPVSSLRMRRDKHGKYIVENLCRFVCESETEALKFYALGSSRKTFRGHLLNARSSRSHTMLHLYLTLRKNASSGGGGSTGGAMAGDEEFEVEVVIVDLAGSERLKSISESHRIGSSSDRGSSAGSGALAASSFAPPSGPTLVTESVSINKSLLTLGKVISMLADNATAAAVARAGAVASSAAAAAAAAGKSGSGTLTPAAKTAAAVAPKQQAFIPYRDSKLTMLLSNALGGNSATLMVACVHSGDHQVNETLSTLYYASRTRRIVNSRKLEEDPRNARLRQLTAEVASLKKELAIANDTIAMLQSTTSGGGGGGRGGIPKGVPVAAFAAAWTTPRGGSTDAGASQSYPPPDAPRPADIGGGSRPGERDPPDPSLPIDGAGDAGSTTATQQQEQLLAQLAASLVASCDKLQAVLAANRRLRVHIDINRVAVDSVHAEREQLVHENLSMRARLDAYDALLMEQIAARTAQSILAKARGSDAAAASPSARRRGDRPQHVVFATVASATAAPLAVKSTKHNSSSSTRHPLASSGAASAVCGSLPAAAAPAAGRSPRPLSQFAFASASGMTPVAPASGVRGGRPASAGGHHQQQQQALSHRSLVLTDRTSGPPQPPPLLTTQHTHLSGAYPQHLHPQPHQLPGAGAGMGVSPRTVSAGVPALSFMQSPH